MKVLVLYRSHSEHARTVEDYMHDFQRRYNTAKVELQDVDTREGDSVASLYDVVQYPSILIVQTDGYLQHSWAGDPLPLMDEVAAYARA